MSDNGVLYKINIQHAASPVELKAFCEILEKHNYGVVTDLNSGRLEVYQSGDEP